MLDAILAAQLHYDCAYVSHYYLCDIRQSQAVLNRRPGTLITYTNLGNKHKVEVFIYETSEGYQYRFKLGKEWVPAERTGLNLHKPIDAGNCFWDTFSVLGSPAHTSFECVE